MWLLYGAYAATAAVLDTANCSLNPSLGACVEAGISAAGYGIFKSGIKLRTLKNLYFGRGDPVSPRWFDSEPVGFAANQTLRRLANYCIALCNDFYAAGTVAGAISISSPDASSITWLRASAKE